MFFLRKYLGKELLFFMIKKAKQKLLFETYEWNFGKEKRTLRAFFAVRSPFNLVWFHISKS